MAATPQDLSNYLHCGRCQLLSIILTNYGELMCIFCGMNPFVLGPPSPPKELKGLKGLINTDDSSPGQSYWSSLTDEKPKPITLADIEAAYEKVRNAPIKPQVYFMSQAEYDYRKRNGLWPFSDKSA